MSAFKDQYFSILSDSIGTFEGYIPTDYPSFYSRWNRGITNVYGPEETWWGRVIAHFGARLLVNNAYSGSCVCKTSECEVESYGCSDARCGGLHNEAHTPDHILVYIGSNDRGRCLQLHSEDKTDLSVLENAYGLMLDKLRSNYPQAVIWCCTFPKTTCSSEPEFVFPESQAGVPMAEYARLIRNAAAARQCRVIDLAETAELVDTIDHLHPNYDGMKAIADAVIAEMEKYAAGKHI